MTPAARDMMAAWLASGDPAKQAHARNRLAIAEGRTPDPPVTPPAVRTQLAALKRARACPHREPCGCVYAKCDIGFGDFDQGKRASLAHCAACVHGGLAP